MRYLLAALVAVSAGQVQAQASDWEFAASLYGWFPNTDVTVGTPLGEVEGELSFSDAFESLEMTFMGALHAQNGRVGVLTDIIYVNLGNVVATPGFVGFTDANLDSNTTIVNALVTYEVLNQGATRIDVGVGGRFYWADNDVVLTNAAGGEVEFDGDDNWADPIVALRYRGDFAENWYGTALVDVGGFGAGSDFTWQGIATIGYRVNDRFSVEGGYRFLKSDRDEDAGLIDIEMSGPMLGATFRF